MPYRKLPSSREHRNAVRVIGVTVPAAAIAAKGTFETVRCMLRAMVGPRLFRRVAVVVATAVSTAVRLPAQERESNEAWRIIVPPQSSLVFARDGSLIGELGKEKRTLVSIRTLPRYLGQAFVAVEDQRFYQHDGVDVVKPRRRSGGRAG